MRSERAIPAYTSSTEAISVMEEKKPDAFDLVLNVLREHEASLDTLIERLDILIEAFSMIQHRLEDLCSKIEQIA